jgi:hypothetical protein
MPSEYRIAGAFLCVPNFCRNDALDSRSPAATPSSGGYSADSSSSMPASSLSAAACVFATSSRFVRTLRRRRARTRTSAAGRGARALRIGARHELREQRVGRLEVPLQVGELRLLDEVGARAPARRRTRSRPWQHARAASAPRPGCPSAASTRAATRSVRSRQLALLVARQILVGHAERRIAVSGLEQRQRLHRERFLGEGRLPSGRDGAELLRRRGLVPAQVAAPAELPGRLLLCSGTSTRAVYSVPPPSYFCCAKRFSGHRERGLLAEPMRRHERAQGRGARRRLFVATERVQREARAVERHRRAGPRARVAGTAS